MKDVIKVTAQEAENYMLLNKQVEQAIGYRLPYIVMCKGYGEDYDNYSELTIDDLDNDNVANGGYDDYQLWLTDNQTGVLFEYGYTAPTCQHNDFNDYLEKCNDCGMKLEDMPKEVQELYEAQFSEEGIEEVIGKAESIRDGLREDGKYV